MARSKGQPNGRIDRLEEALTRLLQSQIALTQQHGDFLTSIREIDRVTSERFARIDDRFARIENILMQHTAVLNEHTRTLERLPEAIREKIGFKAVEKQ